MGLMGGGGGGGKIMMDYEALLIVTYIYSVNCFYCTGPFVNIQLKNMKFWFFEGPTSGFEVVTYMSKLKGGGPQMQFPTGPGDSVTPLCVYIDYEKNQFKNEN